MFSYQEGYLTCGTVGLAFKEIWFYISGVTRFLPYHKF